MNTLARARHLFIPRPQQISSFLLAILFTALCGLSAQAAPGDLDPTFGTDGIVITSLSGYDDSANDVVTQPDGKIVAVGNGYNGTNYDFALVRYNTNGALDVTFNSTGEVRTPIGSGDDMAYAVAIQPDGKIVVAGYSFNGANYDFALVRYNTDGMLDTTFNSTGKLTTPIDIKDSYARAVVIQPDGKIIAIGGSDNGRADDDFALARYNTDGTLDTTFNSTGIVITSISDRRDFATAAAIQSDGKIVAAGISRLNFALVRYNPDGSLDTTFNSTGKVITDYSYTDIAFAVAIQPDGKIVAAGYTSRGIHYDYDFMLARYNTDGTLDTTFNSTGIVITDIAFTNDSAYAVAIQPDGKIVAAGGSDNGSSGFLALTRYNLDGTLDTTFNSTGKVVTPISGYSDGALAVTVQPDGKIIAAGRSDNGIENDNIMYSAFALVRYQGLTTTTAVKAGDVVISEFRFSGPNGNTTDEFIELYNNTNNDIMVSDPNGGAGWLLLCSNGTGSAPQKSRQLSQNTKPSRRNVVASSDFLIPNGTVLPAHRHFLIAHAGYSLQNSGGINHAFPDLSSTFDMPDNGGVSLFASSVSTGTRLDAVGFSTAGDARFYEGTPLTPINAAATNEQYSFIRKINNEVVQDTNNNSADFILISPTATVGGAAAVLGAVGPENLFAPIYKSPAQISGQYLDPTAPSTAAPNRAIENGILKLRRIYTNNTGADVRRLRFRVFDLTTLNNTQGVPAPVADLRVISSQNETLNTAFGSKTALALTREEPPDQTTTLLDGGLHTTLSADTVTLVNPLGAGQSINVAYWLRVVTGGRFRFFVNIEALP